ncbi:hypothetical protein C8J57DRAFT_1615023 [Mycena rebaudengoi]|nr:hypothetical protein C8J57DRAFT_1615023 [Mycena rebaudengoi]
MTACRQPHTAQQWGYSNGKPDEDKYSGGGGGSSGNTVPRPPDREEDSSQPAAPPPKKTRSAQLLLHSLHCASYKVLPIAVVLSTKGPLCGGPASAQVGEAEAPESDVRPPDVLWTSLHAGRCRPTLLAPLKSVVGGAVAIWDIAELTSAQRAKRSRTEARDIALRTKEIVDLIADAVPDPSEIPPSMLLSIDGFTLINSSPSSALDEIRCGMEAIELSGSLSCLVHLNRHDRTIQGIKTRLDAEYRDFLAASALRVEVQQAANALIQAQMQSEIKMVSASTFFWLAPDVLAVPHLCIGIGSPVRYA